MGLSVSDVIRMVLLRVAEEKRLPFVVQRSDMLIPVRSLQFKRDVRIL